MVKNKCGVSPLCSGIVPVTLTIGVWVGELCDEPEVTSVSRLVVKDLSGTAKVVRPVRWVGGPAAVPELDTLL